MSDLFGTPDSIEDLIPLFKSICEKLQSEMNLPINALSVDHTIGTGIITNGVLISVVANILDCDCPYTKEKLSDEHYTATAAFTITRANLKNLAIEFIVPKSAVGVKIPTAAKVLKDLGSSIKYRMPFVMDGLPELIESSIRYAVDHFVTKADKFGCCHRYLECSDAKMCVNPNRFYATACEYRKNLLNGKIFYGVNKNV